jgi:outer membrane cobalamin receptor
MKALCSCRWILLLVALAGCRTTANFDPICPVPPARGHGITRSDISRAGASTVVEALRGRVPGLLVRNVGGRPFLQVRGSASFSSVEPLVVVDGVKMSQRGARGLDGLNVRDVAQVEVLKNAGELALYGSDGGAGVLVVYTRKSGCD